MKIAYRELGSGDPCLIVAELSSNHNGDYDRALRIIDAAAHAGADAVKFQAFTLDEILALRGEGQAPTPWNAYTKRELYTKAITPSDWFPGLFKRAVPENGLIAFASVFGLESLAMLEALDCPAYKIAKPEANYDPLLRIVARTKKPTFVSNGLYGDLPENWRRLWCPAGYPAPLDEMELEHLLSPNCAGLSCHCPDPLVGPVAAALGAQYLEFHLTLDDGVPTLDDCINLTQTQFAEMVRLTRAAEAML